MISIHKSNHFYYTQYQSTTIQYDYGQLHEPVPIIQSNTDSYCSGKIRIYDQQTPSPSLKSSEYPAKPGKYTRSDPSVITQ